MNFKENQLRALFLLTICIFAYSTWMVQTRETSGLTNQDFIRFHVIANSDGQEDQELKGLVRDELLTMITNDLAAYAMSSAGQGEENPTLDMETSRTFIQDRIPEIEKAAETIIAKQGYDYTVSAALGARWVPEKSYGSITFPAGNYEALNVVIGEGVGENWWCVLFPPLCLIGEEEQDKSDPEVLSAIRATSQNEALFRQALDSEKYEGLLTLAEAERDEPVTLQLKFKVLDMLNIE